MQIQLTGFRLSPQQRHLWILFEKSSAYSAQCGVMIKGSLDVRVLREALHLVVNRHEILRTTFHRPPGTKMPIQVIVEQSAPAWQSVNLDHLSAQEQEARIHESAIEMRRRPCDFVDDPLVDACLFSLSTQKHILLINLPALCADMRTLKNLLEEVAHTYEVVANDGNVLDEPLQYLQFSEWQNELLADEEGQEGRAYWQKQNYAEATALRLPL